MNIQMKYKDESPVKAGVEGAQLGRVLFISKRSMEILKVHRSCELLWLWKLAVVLGKQADPERISN